MTPPVPPREERPHDPLVPRPYDLSDDREMLRLLRELRGYMHTSLKHGTDTKGRQFALDALTKLTDGGLFEARTLRSVEPPPDAINLLRLILPLAKGYAHEHPVGSNQQYVADADGFLARAPAVEPPREMVEKVARVICIAAHVGTKTGFRPDEIQSIADGLWGEYVPEARAAIAEISPTLRSQTLDEAARVADKANQERVAATIRSLR